MLAVPAIGFAPAGVVAIIVPLNCTTPALVHRMIAAQIVAALVLLAVMGD